jgi:hypothetical protein
MVQSRHYPFCHRKYALAYPWSLTTPSFTHYTFDNYRIGLGNDADPTIRLGATAFTSLSDMLTATITANEKLVPKRPLNASLFLGLGTITARYSIDASSLPAGISQINPGTTDNALRLRCSLYYQHGSVGSPVTPTTRQERRNNKHMFYIFMETAFRSVVTNGVSSANVTAGGRWGLNTITLSDMTTIDAIATIARAGDVDSTDLDVSRSTLQGYSSIIGGFPPNTAYDAVVAIESATQTELAALTMQAKYKMAAVLAGVGSSVLNSTGTDSLEDWVPILF